MQERTSECPPTMLPSHGSREVWYTAWIYPAVHPVTKRGVSANGPKWAFLTHFYTVGGSHRAAQCGVALTRGRTARVYVPALCRHRQASSSCV